MKIQLTKNWAGFPPGTLKTVSDERAKSLVDSGYARLVGVNNECKAEGDSKSMLLTEEQQIGIKDALDGAELDRAELEEVKARLENAQAEVTELKDALEVKTEVLDKVNKDLSSALDARNKAEERASKAEAAAEKKNQTKVKKDKG